MKHRFIDVFDFQGNNDLLKYRILKLQNIVELHIICDNSTSDDVEKFITNNLNSFKDKVLILKNFNYKKNLDYLQTILKELKLDYEDIISLSNQNDIPYFENKNFYKSFYFGPYVLNSEIMDINEVTVDEPRQLGSLLMFYHDFKKLDISDLLKTIETNELYTNKYLRLEEGIKIVDGQVDVLSPPSKFIFNFQ